MDLFVQGRTVDFKNTLIIMTSNVGSSVIEKGGGSLGFQLDTGEEDSSYNRIKTLVNEELKQYFRPEFLNRLDEIIVFRQLSKSEVKEIADIMLAEVFKRALEKDIKIDVTERFKVSLRASLGVTRAQVCNFLGNVSWCGGRFLGEDFLGNCRNQMLPCS